MRAGLLLLAFSLVLGACGKSPKPVEAAKREEPAPKAEQGAPEVSLFRYQFNDPAIPAAPDHTQRHPGPGGAQADRAGITIGTTEKTLGVRWQTRAAPGGQVEVSAAVVEVNYKMSIAIGVSSDYKEDSCPYRVTWEHELSHARAYVSMFDASKVHLEAAFEHAQEEEPRLPTAGAPRLVKAEEVPGLERELGDKLRGVLEDQARVLNTLMDDHRRDRDSPQAYKADWEKCPQGDWQPHPNGS
ncbi:MAG: hypothetical protein HY077_17375 [Elusimicrobia bacterium]|nr:hypothetical protein [Elusimicrobiota bacterium]